MSEVIRVPPEPSVEAERARSRVEFMWASRVVEAACTPCAAIAPRESVFTGRSGREVPMLGTRCGRCGAVTIRGGEGQVERDDLHIDGYLLAVVSREVVNAG